MKHIYTIVAFILSAFCVVGCTALDNEMGVENEGSYNVLEATLEGKKDTRTVMGELANGVYKTLWSADDIIGVFIDRGNNVALYELMSGEGETTASFKGYGKGDSYVALYPGTMLKGLEGDCLSLELPAEQAYSEKSFGPNCFPMLAVSPNSSLSFKNLCGVIKVSMTGHHNIKSIVFQTNDPDIYVSGEAQVDIANPTSPTLVMQSGASNEVTLLCNGTRLSQEEEISFHIVLPAQTYKGGFTLIVNTSTGRMIKTVTEDVTLERSQIRALKTFVCKLDEGIEPSTALEGKGTEESPFLINNLADLLLMQGVVNAENGKLSPMDGSEEIMARSACYKLTQDISLAEVCGAEIGSWTPIGHYAENADSKFCGIFDGNGYVISDMYINGSELESQGFFGFVGFSGDKRGIIKNLIVKGHVKGKSSIGMVCGTSETDIENCGAYGSVEASQGYSAGIVGCGANVKRCINYADVIGNGLFVGGVTGSSSNEVSGCTNIGSVANSGTYTGGIIGYQNTGNLYNCCNLGKITGTGYVGGITGYSRQGANLYNSYNAAEVVGEEYVGGITGYCKHDASYDKTRGTNHSEVMNCLNVGEVKANGANCVGSIAGLNDALLANCYWLYDVATKQGLADGIGHNLAQAENNYGLTDAQLKGENYHTALYVSADNTPYYKLLDALNAWADDNKTESLDLYGWEQTDSNSYPTLSGKVAEKPVDDNKPIFELSEKEFHVSSKGGNISISVAANMGYYISSIPEWIVETTTASSARAVTETLHEFLVQENLDSEERQGIIVFCNESLQCIPVVVIQKGKVGEDMAWTEKEFLHKSLAMRFTADWCGYCPRLADAFAEAQKQSPGKIEAVHMHCDGGQAFSDAYALMNQYKIEGFPTGVVDGRMLVYSASDVINAMNATEAKYGTQTGIRFDSRISNDQLTVNVNLYLKKADKYKITVLLLEGGIVGYQADYVNGAHQDYVHNDVPRLALTNVSGDEFSTASDNLVEEFSYKGTIPSKCNKDNLRILVYVQRAYGTQPIIASDDYGIYYVDNSLSEKVGVNADLKFVE